MLSFSKIHKNFVMITFFIKLINYNKNYLGVFSVSIIYAYNAYRKTAKKLSEICM